MAAIPPMKARIQLVGEGSERDRLSGWLEQSPLFERVVERADCTVLVHEPPDHDALGALGALGESDAAVVVAPELDAELRRVALVRPATELRTLGELGPGVLATAIQDARARASALRAMLGRIRLEASAEAQGALSEADRRRDRFIALLAHELRSPLAPVKSAVEILRRLGPTEARQVRALDLVDRQVTHMARLIDDLLDVSRISRGKLELRLEQCDLGQLARQAADDQRASFDTAQLSLAVDTPKAPVWVDGDPVRLVQLLGSLLQNACRFTREGGRVDVRVGVELDSGRAFAEVRDTGVGIEPELQRRVFRPFEQADQGLAREKGGLGLGLALAKGLADLHAGDLSVHSDGPGKGASFTLTLPLGPGQQEQTPSNGAHARLGPAGLRILVVDDSQDTAESLGELLELSGHHVALAFDARSALERAKRDAPEVVISDIGLPGDLDGFGLARQLRAEAGFEGVLLVALSGYSDEETRRRSADAGFDFHLAKPPNFKLLEKALESVAR